MAKCGLPSLIISNYKDEKEITRSFAKTGAAIDLGCVDNLDESFFLETVNRIMREKTDLKLMSLAAKKLMKGEGMINICKHIL